MKISTVYATKAVSSSEAIKHFKDCLSGEPVAVLANKEPIGYMMSATFFEGLIEALESNNIDSVSLFRPMSTRLEQIAILGAQTLKGLDASDLGDIQE